jgi:hypothetical protein
MSLHPNIYFSRYAFDHFNLVCIEIVEKIVKLLYILSRAIGLSLAAALFLPTLSQTRASIFRHAMTTDLLF